MEKNSWTDHVRIEVLQRVKEERNIRHTIRRRNTKWIGRILCRNCLLTHSIEGKVEGRIEVMGRRGRRRTQFWDDFKEKRILEIEIGITRTHSVGNSLRKLLWTCRETDY